MYFMVLFEAHVRHAAASVHLDLFMCWSWPCELWVRASGECFFFWHFQVQCGAMILGATHIPTKKKTKTVKVLPCQCIRFGT